MSTKSVLSIEKIQGEDLLFIKQQDFPNPILKGMITIDKYDYFKYIIAKILAHKKEDDRFNHQQIEDTTNLQINQQLSHRWLGLVPISIQALKRKQKYVTSDKTVKYKD